MGDVQIAGAEIERRERGGPKGGAHGWATYTSQEQKLNAANAAAPQG